MNTQRCRACGVESTNDLCIYCNIWERRARDNRSRSQVRVGGVLYIIKLETRNTRLVEGSTDYEHQIEFKNGRKIYTTNLARGGKIPAYFIKRMPDNAKFISVEKRTTEA